jgi:hypothetical protein
MLKNPEKRGDFLRSGAKNVSATCAVEIEASRSPENLSCPGDILPVREDIRASVEVTVLG